VPVNPTYLLTLLVAALGFAFQALAFILLLVLAGAGKLLVMVLNVVRVRRPGKPNE
jgi:hypothetical protein